MKKFLSTYWKRILILIASIFIIVNIVSKCIAPHVLVQEYSKFGPDRENIVNIDTSEIIAEVKDSSPFGEDMTRIVIILAAGILIACVISELANKKSSSGKKK